MNTRRACRLIPAAVALMLCACDLYESEDYVIDATTLDTALHLDAENAGGQAVTAVAADGFSRITLRIRIDSLAASNRRTVSLTTTAGSFLGGIGSDALARKVTVGTDARGSLQLMSNKTAQTVVVTASVDNASIARTLEIGFVPPILDSILRFTLLPAALPADGITTGEVGVAVSPLLSGTVSFVLSGGGVATPNPATPDLTGRARVFVSSGRIGPALLTATAGGFSRDTVLQFRQPTPLEILRFTEVPSTLVADGSTDAVARAIVPAQLTGAQRDVQFELTVGTIQGSTKITPTAPGQATVVFRSSAVGLGTLRATAGGFSVDTTVQFVPAGPDSVFLDVGTGSVKAGQSLLVTATLHRVKGKTTPGTLVRFQAFDANNTERGQFINVQASGAEGKSTATWIASGVAANEAIRIVATATAFGKSASAPVAVTP